MKNSREAGWSGRRKGRKEKRRSEVNRDRMAQCLVGTIRAFDFALSEMRVFSSLEYMIQLERFKWIPQLPSGG